jgi:hypothetical protein
MNEHITLKKVGNIELRLTAEVEYDLDLSWDKDGKVREGIENGDYDVFCAKVSTLRKGVEIGADYLGECIYRSLQEFADGAGPKGDYCRDMMHSALRAAREWAK